MSAENDLKVFTVRLPQSLVEQIDQRAGFHKRKRNGEITVLLEMAIDLAVARDQQVAKVHASIGA